MHHPHTLIVGETTKNLVAWIDGQMYHADQSNPRFDELVLACQNGDADAADLFSPVKAIRTAFARCTERVTVENDTVCLDGVPVHNVLTRAIIRFHDQDLPFMPLVNFLELVEQNPNEDSRENLYRFLEACGDGLTITEEGYILGAKGVFVNEDGSFSSINSGYARVNDVDQNGRITQRVGDVVSMPRDMVEHDPDEACSFGLHIGTWDYAHSFGHGNVIQVIVNPRDVVSVPRDSGDQKMRCCRYTVVALTSQQLDSALFYSSKDYADDLDAQSFECDECEDDPSQCDCNDDMPPFGY